MRSKCAHFWMGLGLGSVLGAIVYRCCKSSKAKQLKEKVTHAFHKATDQAEDMVDSAKDKAVNAGEKVADKVANKTSNLAEDAYDMKNKAHNFAEDIKK